MRTEKWSARNSACEDESGNAGDDASRDSSRRRGSRPNSTTSGYTVVATPHRRICLVDLADRPGSLHTILISRLAHGATYNILLLVFGRPCRAICRNLDGQAFEDLRMSWQRFSFGHQQATRLSKVILQSTPTAVGLSLALLE